MRRHVWRHHSGRRRLWEFCGGVCSPNTPKSDLPSWEALQTEEISSGTGGLERMGLGIPAVRANTSSVSLTLDTRLGYRRTDLEYQGATDRE